MKLLPNEALDVVWEDHEDWKKVEDKIVGSSRWNKICEGVFLHLPTNKHYQVRWRVGATEMQNEPPFSYEDDVEFIEVEQKPVTVMKWVVV